MIIRIQCSDRVGLVADVSGILAKNGMNIESMREFVDKETGKFFLRITADKEPPDDELREQLAKALPEKAAIDISRRTRDKKLVVLVTKEYHCLSDILTRNHFQTLGARVEAVIGNQPDLQDICDRFNIPFMFITHEGKNKEAFEKELREKIQLYAFDYIILAKFMRILSDEFVAEYPYKIINIHHSFLPAFVGASPYRQAFERGVKLIGATAHFVTSLLDEGPIIEQQIVRVNHTYTPKDMVVAGKEIETSVLAKAMSLVFEDRVFVSNNKTVVFD
ncbi:MAG TPA: formyltetrahydrofolate deformylase [Flavitalea sp.]|nr:formyltetrahydrofolate deformylase [Flavitalea sp.]